MSLWRAREAKTASTAATFPYGLFPFCFLLRKKDPLIIYWMVRETEKWFWIFFESFLPKASSKSPQKGPFHRREWGKKGKKKKGTRNNSGGGPPSFSLTGFYNFEWNSCIKMLIVFRRILVSHKQLDSSNPLWKIL